MATYRTTSLATSVNTFLDEADWLDETALPAIMQLKILAQEIDTALKTGEKTAPLHAQFGLAYRSLLKLKSGDDGAMDAADAALAAIGV